MSLEGKVALITGASRGIGRAIALRLAKEGVRVAVAAKTVTPHPTLPGTIGETAEACEALGTEALAVRMNVRNDDDVAAGVADTVARFGRIDMAIHNAGALWWKPIADTPIRRFDMVMDVNVRGAHSLAIHTLPHLKAAGGGHFLVMSPPVVLEALPGKTAYLISKYGMTMVAMGLAAEHKADNIAANALWPETAIESAATIHFKLGTPAMWYKADLVADATYEVVRQPPAERTGQALLVMDVMREAGVTDFTPYRCDPNSEPPLFTVTDIPRAGGDEKAGGQIRSQTS